MEGGGGRVGEGDTIGMRGVLDKQTSGGSSTGCIRKGRSWFVVWRSIKFTIITLNLQ